MPKAARLTDPIGHSPVMSGLLIGLLAGAAIGIAVAGTGGLAAVAIVGASAAAGAGIFEVLSTMSFVPKEICGAIAGIGSPNVFTNSLAAARANLDFTLCSKHPGPPIPISTGSSTVFINGQPAARVDDTTFCGAVITSGSNNVYIGGGVTGTIRPEHLVPGWVHATLLVVGVGCAAVLGGPVVAIAGLVGGLVGANAGAWLGGKLFGQGSDGQKAFMLVGAIVGGSVAAGGATASLRLATAKSVPVVSENAPAVPERVPEFSQTGETVPEASLALPKSDPAVPETVAAPEPNPAPTQERIPAARSDPDAKILELPPDQIRLSQKGVSFKKERGGKTYTYDEIVENMRNDGWVGDPVDVVRMPDRDLTSMDNTRIAAARDAGIPARVRIRDFDEPLTAEMKASRDWWEYNTWGEAIMGRIKRQGNSFSTKNPYGSPQSPIIKGRPNE